jgi:hypothetical protein
MLAIFNNFNLVSYELYMIVIFGHYVVQYRRHNPTKSRVFMTKLSYYFYYLD